MTATKFFIVPESALFSSEPGKVIESRKDAFVLQRKDGVVGIYSFDKNTFVEVFEDETRSSD